MKGKKQSFTGIYFLRFQEKDILNKSKQQNMEEKLQLENVFNHPLKQATNYERTDESTLLPRWQGCSVFMGQKEQEKK